MSSILMGKIWLGGIVNISHSNHFSIVVNSSAITQKSFLSFCFCLYVYISNQPSQYHCLLKCPHFSLTAIILVMSFHRRSISQLVACILFYVFTFHFDFVAMSPAESITLLESALELLSISNHFPKEHTFLFCKALHGLIKCFFQSSVMTFPACAHISLCRLSLL